MTSLMAKIATLALMMSLLSGCANMAVSAKNARPDMVKPETGMAVGEFFVLPTYGELSGGSQYSTIDFVETESLVTGKAEFVVEDDGYFAFILPEGEYEVTSFGNERTEYSADYRTTHSQKLPVSIPFVVEAGQTTNLGYVLIAFSREQPGRFRFLLFDNSEKMAALVSQRQQNLASVINISQLLKTPGVDMISEADGGEFFNSVNPLLSPYR